VTYPRAAGPRLPAAYFGFTGKRPQRSLSWEVLQNRSFRYYFIGSVTSDFGTWLANTAQLLLAFKLSHSVLVVGLVTCAQFSTPLVLGPWAGVMTDKFGSRRILLAAQVAAAGCAATMATLAFEGQLHTRWLGCGAIVSGLAFTMTLPARNVTVRRLVPEEDIGAAYAMDSVSYNLGRAVAPPVSVLLVAQLGFGWAFAANAASFVLFAVCLLVAGQGQPQEKRREKSRLRDGFNFARHNKKIIVLLAMVAAVTVADDPVLVLGPALATHLHAGPGWSGWFIAALGAGTVCGSLLPPFEPSLRIAATALAVLAACMASFVLVPLVWACACAAFGAGMMCLIANSVTRTLLATEAGPEHEASVMAVWAIAWAGSKPFASLADGALASSWIGVTTTGVLLALPALVPIGVLIALPALVIAIRRYRPQLRDKLTKAGWYRVTEDYLVGASSASTDNEARILSHLRL
jgi:predicted MFS family arabinose efflux permease